MNKEQIKAQLINRVTNEIHRNNQVSNGLDRLDQLVDNLQSSEAFGNRITQILNQILLENNVELDDKSRNELITFLKPTFIELMQKNIMK
jgi:hypothetical protein